MVEDNDLLPWILGGALALAAVAATALSDPTAPPAAPVVATTSSKQAPPSATAAPPAVHGELAPAVAAPTPRAQLPPGQVWECGVAGQRVFSDKQCGAHATVRQLTELNVFDSSTAYAHVPPRPYGGPGPAPGYYPQPEPASEAPPEDSDANYPVYTGTPVVVVHDHRHRDHGAHRGNHPQPRAARP
jgi:hypothetical protein